MQILVVVATCPIRGFSTAPLPSSDKNAFFCQYQQQKPCDYYAYQVNEVAKIKCYLSNFSLLLCLDWTNQVLGNKVSLLRLQGCANLHQPTSQLSLSIFFSLFDLTKNKNEATKEAPRV